MNKGYVIGGLAVLGAIALISMYKKPKRNSEGFFGAEGEGTVGSNWCARRNADGSVIFTNSRFDPKCPKGFKRVKYFGDRTGV